MRAFKFVRFERKYVGAYPATTYKAPALEVRAGVWHYPFAFAEDNSPALERGVVTAAEHGVTVVGEVVDGGGMVGFSATAEVALQLDRRAGWLQDFRYRVEGLPGTFRGVTRAKSGRVAFSGSDVDGDTPVTITFDPARFLESLPTPPPPSCLVPEHELIATARLLDRLLDGNWRDDPEAVAIFEALDKRIDMFELFGDRVSPLPY